MLEENDTIIEALRKYIRECPLLDELAPINIDMVGPDPTNYSIFTSGITKVSEDILGNSTYQYNAVLQSREYTCDDAQRLINNGFTEQFIFYIANKDNHKQFPALPAGLYPVSIYADNGMLMAVDDNGDKGIYQVQLHLIFIEESEEF